MSENPHDNALPESPEPSPDRSPELPLSSELRLELPEGWADTLKAPPESLTNWEPDKEDHPYTLTLFFPREGGPVILSERGRVSFWDRCLGRQARRSVRVTETGVEVAAFARGGWWDDKVKRFFRRTK